MSKFVHPRNLICDKDPNQPKNQNIEGIVLVEEDVKVVQQGANAILVLVFTHANSADKQLYAANQYIYVAQEGTQGGLFVLVEALVPAEGDGCIVALAVDRNDCTDGTEANDAQNVLSGRTLNIYLEDMAELRRQGISTEDDNNSAPQNVPRQGETNDGTCNWRREGNICQHKSGNLQNYFASFRHYLHDTFLCMSLLQLFLVMFPEKNIEQVLITDTNKGLSVPMNL